MSGYQDSLCNLPALSKRTQVQVLGGRYAGGPFLDYSSARDAARGKADRAEESDVTLPAYCGCSLMKF